MLSSTKQDNQNLVTMFDLWKWPILSIQLIFYPALLFLKWVIVGNSLKINPDFIINDKARYVIYSNHQSMLDPFIIFASLPFNTIIRLVPFRAFVKNKYFDNSIIAFFLKTFGSFQTHPIPKGLYGLNKARVLLDTNQTVVIFPPGTRTREKIAKYGIAILAREPKTYLIPILIDWKSRWNCHVTIGGPFRSKKLQSPEELMDVVYKLNI